MKDHREGVAPAGRRRGAAAVWALAGLLAVVHNDLWWWDDGNLVFGFLPTGLAFHALFSIVAAGLWALALRFVWPHELEHMADG